MAAPFGNRNNSKGTAVTDAVRKALIQYQKGDIKSGQALSRIADNIVQLAIENDRWAIEFIADRLDGKPKQAVEHSGSVTVESVSDEQARMMAEALIDSARASSGVREEVADRVHDSLSS